MRRAAAAVLCMAGCAPVAQPPVLLPSGDGPPATTASGDSALSLPPAGYGSLRQDEFSVEIVDGPLHLKVTPLAERSNWGRKIATGELEGLDRIAIIDPDRGLVTGWVDLHGLLPAPLARDVDVLNGIAYDETPIQDHLRNPGIPGNDRLVFALGAGVRLSETITIDVGYTYNHELDASIRQTRPESGTVEGEYRNRVHILSGQLRWIF